MENSKEVYKAISAVQGEMAVLGISKEHTNTQGSGYKFRGIDDVYNALAPILAKHKLVIMPRVIRRELVERVSKSGGALFYIVLEVEYDFISAVDGSIHTAKGIGEAMDSGDKGTNKAMSAAYKYVCFQAFCIPTEGDNDADASTHEVKAEDKSAPKSEPRPAQAPSLPSKGKVVGSIIKHYPSDGKKPHAYKLDCSIEYFKTFDQAMADTIEDIKGGLIEIAYEVVVDKGYKNNMITAVSVAPVEDVGF